MLGARDQFLGYIRKRIGDPDLAEDILQDSLLPSHPCRPGAARRGAHRPLVLPRPPERDRRRLSPSGVERAHLVAGDVPEIVAEPEDDAELCACFERLVPTLKSEYADADPGRQAGE